MQDYNIYKNPREHFTLPRLLICWFTALFFLVFLTPQGQVLGRGERTGIVALIVVFTVALLCEQQSLFGAISRSRSVLFFVTIFVTQSSLRFFGANEAPQIAIVMSYIIEPLIITAAILLLLLLVELGNNEIRLFRIIIVIVWSCSLALGIPVELENFGAARTAMEADQEIRGSFALSGVGVFATYASYAVIFPSMVAQVLQCNCLTRISGLICLIGGALAVLVSTFTMASALLAVGIISLIITGQGKAGRIISLFCVVFVLAFGSTILENAARFSPQIDFVYQKTIRLVSGIATKGIAEGDETGRGKMVKASIDVIKQGNWLVGYVDGMTPKGAGGHSSLFDSLALFGLPGALLWLGVLVCIIRLAAEHNKFTKNALVVSWILFASSGVLNPTWFTAAFVATLAAYTIGKPQCAEQIEEARQV